MALRSITCCLAPTPPTGWPLHCRQQRPRRDKVWTPCGLRVRHPFRPGASAMPTSSALFVHSYAASMRATSPARMCWPTAALTPALSKRVDMTYKTDLFAGKTALATGATQGIGAAVANRLASLGARTIAVGLHSETNELQSGLKSEEHTSELPYLMRISHPVFSLKQN